MLNQIPLFEPPMLVHAIRLPHGWKTRIDVWSMKEKKHQVNIILGGCMNLRASDVPVLRNLNIGINIGVDSSFFSTIVLFNHQPFSLRFPFGFLERRIP